jgi:hypothetical protein
MNVDDILIIVKEIFDEEKGLVKSIDNVFEKSEDDKFLKMVISIHNLCIEDTIIIHTKFIFKVDLDKIDLIENNFIYLYDINCIYHGINFNGEEDLRKKMKYIINSNKFGKDIQILSDFIDSPAFLLDKYLSNNNITEYNVDNISYTPKFKTTPCDKTTFDFDISVNNKYKINLSIKKENVDVKNIYKFTFKYLDNIEEFKINNLENIAHIIGSKLIDLLNKYITKK